MAADRRRKALGHRRDHIVALSESLNILHILASKCIACKLLIKAMTNENGAAAAQKNELP